MTKNELPKFQKSNNKNSNSKGGGDTGKTSLISVIVPVYNVEKYINKCIESVVNQTYKNLEIICVDDKGKDNSIGIVKEYAIKDDRIKIITHDKNYGLAISRNTGLKNAKGEYIFFLDSDDYITLDIIEKLFNKITLDKSNIVVASARAFCEDNEKTIKERVEKYNQAFQQLYKTDYIQIDFNNFNLFSDILFHTAWGRLYKAEFLKECNL